MAPHGAAQSRYVNPTNACQSFLPHPSTFAFTGFEGAKRHRLCRPSGNPPLRQPNQCLPKLPAPPIHLCFYRVRRCQTAPALPTKWRPVGLESCWGSAVSDACSPATLAAVTCLWSGWCPTVLPRAVTSTQPMPAKASCPTHPPLL